MMRIISSIIGTLCFLGLTLFMYFTIPSPLWFAIMIAPILWWCLAIPKFKQIKKENEEADRKLQSKRDNPTLPKNGSEKC